MWLIPYADDQYCFITKHLYYVTKSCLQVLYGVLLIIWVFLVLLSSLFKFFSVHDMLGPEWSQNAGNRISELSDFQNVPGGVYPRSPVMILSLQLQMAWSINVNTGHGPEFQLSNSRCSVDYCAAVDVV